MKNMIYYLAIALSISALFVSCEEDDDDGGDTGRKIELPRDNFIGSYTITANCFIPNRPIQGPDQVSNIFFIEEPTDTAYSDDKYVYVRGLECGNDFGCNDHASVSGSTLLFVDNLIGSATLSADGLTLTIAYEDDGSPFADCTGTAVRN